MALGNKKTTKKSTEEEEVPARQSKLGKKKKEAAEKRAARKAEQQAKKDATKVTEPDQEVADQEVADQEAAYQEAAEKPVSDPEVAEKPASDPEPAEKPASDPEKAAVPAVKKRAKPPAKGGKLVLALADLENALPIVEFGTLPRIVAKSGKFYDDDGDCLGEEIEVSFHSYNESFTISPNEDKAPKSLCRFSYDNEELTYPFEDEETGEVNTTVAEHVAYLKELGYKKAAARRYLEVTCTLQDAEDDNDNIGGLVQLSLSPQSVKQFDRYKYQCTVQINTGAITESEAMVVHAKAKNRTFGTNTFTIFTFKRA